ncbi:O-antigen ligase family protein [bacterium]|nr:O-antigen ligase family protein [bacterium]
MKTIAKKITDIIGNRPLFTVAVIIAFWIKFNIVLFTYKPYTATKIFFPLFLFIILGYCLKHFGRKILSDPRVILLSIVVITFLLPVGYLSHPHDWGLYKKMGLSIISFFTLYFSAILLDSKGKKLLFFFIYFFCLVALGYLLLQVHFNWSYQMGHFRNSNPIPRPFGILDDPDHSSGIYIIGFFISIGLGFYKKRYFLVSPIALLFIYAIIKSQCAGAIIGLLGGMSIFVIGLSTIFIKQISGKSLFVLMWLVWFSIFGFMVGFFWFYKGNLWGFADLLNTYKSEYTILARLDLMLLAKNIFLEHPIFGVGFANDFNPAIINMYKSSNMVTATELHIHTSYLSALSTTGFVGLVSLCALVSLSVCQYAQNFASQKRKSKRILMLCFFSLFISIQILGYSLQYLYSISFWFSFILPYLLPFTFEN